MQRSFSVPSTLEQKIDRALKKQFQLSLQDSKKLAEAVKKLSDFFIANPDGATPWKETWAQIAYLVYFLPLNHARAQAVATEARRQGFFSGLSEVIDFGAGLGTASLALDQDFRNFTMIERAKDICARFDFLPENTQWLEKIEKLGQPEKSLTVFSYSLTELEEIPGWAQKSEALMILEPSTQQDGRKLMELRQKLIDQGYSLWAPCAHQKHCPLLNRSKTDWCHDRIFFVLPEWFAALEQHLPMKNRTLTTSYLLARKTKAPAKGENTARTVGDRMREKGKDRQMICRGEEREFLAWMHKQGIDQEIPRGVLIDLPENLQKVSNELRLQGMIQII
jgi:ribosomal protein RSM22 (predicted rRNA methylase)